MKNIFVFDVESKSLFDQGFAVGAIVISRDGKILDSFELLCIEGAAHASEWVKDNVIPHLKDMPTCAYTHTLYDKFYEFYTKHKDTSEFWADCCFPVETNFLNDVAWDDIDKREFAMPYPLKDISTIVDINLDRLELCGISGLRKHNPLDDATASAFCLLKKLKK